MEIMTGASSSISGKSDGIRTGLDWAQDRSWDWDWTGKKIRSGQVWKMRASIHQTLGPCLFFLSPVSSSYSQLGSDSQGAYAITNTCPLVNRGELNKVFHLMCSPYTSDLPAQSSSVSKGVLVSQTKSPNSSSIHTHTYVYPWTISIDLS